MKTLRILASVATNGVTGYANFRLPPCVIVGATMAAKQGGLQDTASILTAQFIIGTYTTQLFADVNSPDERMLAGWSMHLYSLDASFVPLHYEVSALQPFTWMLESSLGVAAGTWYGNLYLTVLPPRV